MALYLAVVRVASGQSLYSALIAHYSKVPTSLPVPSLLPPIPNAVSWIRMASTGLSILGTIDTTPFYDGVVSLDAPVEFGSAASQRNTIPLTGIYFDNVVEALVDLAFMVT